MFILAFEFSKIDFFPSFSWQKRFHKYRGCVKDTFEKVKNNYYYIISRIRYETPCIIYSGMAISQLYFLYYLSIQASTICQDMKQCLFEKSKSFNVGVQIFPASFIMVMKPRIYVHSVLYPVFK